MAALQVSIPCMLTPRKRDFDEFDRNGRSSPHCIMRARVDSGHEATSTTRSLSRKSPARNIIESERSPGVISLADLDSIFGDFDFLPLSLCDEHSSIPSTTSISRRPVGEVSSDVPANDDAAVAAFLNSDDAAWNRLVPTGTKVTIRAVIHAAKTLNFPANSAMSASSLETLRR